MSDRQPNLDAEIRIINLEAVANALLLMEFSDAQAASAINLMTSVMGDCCEGLRKVLALEVARHG